MSQNLITLLLIFAAQAAGSFFTTRVFHAALGDSAARFVMTAALADTVKLGVLSGVATLAVSGNWMGVAAAVAGGALGNLVAHKLRS